ncbi:Anti-sigma factor [Hahella chejuensis KCTC 2396]|uniref:Anti-sigma factor n=1 Tax=Hahella chejuensis (strain KCTC 2396) TaxID=349521 RepID=Q2S7W7_HAHCH|nr:ChrR family anti-sigma-E factor [Hahella chejuensis]ABC33257.1 Anti-sigma factor [Hahella chejuensis KCTC 2396]
MSQHHPSDDILMEYAAGCASPHLALCVAVHLQYCPHCRAGIQRLNALGGEMLQQLPQEDLNEALFERIMLRIELEESAPATLQKPVEDLLQRWLPEGLSAVSWRKQWFKVYEYVLEVSRKGRQRLSLQKIAAGGRAPLHAHYGQEVTVVLQGGFSDELGVYEEGDFVIRSGDQRHRPRALENEDCICLAYLDAPVCLAGPIGRWIERFRRLFMPDLNAPAS